MPLKRWSAEEQQFLDDLRANLGPVLQTGYQVPDVVGDRRLLRFARGHAYDLAKVTEMYKAHLKWRQERGADKVRDDILYGGINHPSKFPHAKIILGHVKQVIITTTSTDIAGSPLCVENYAFSPSAVLAEVTIEDYIEFMIYALEYKVMVCEQMAELEERAFLKSIEGRSAAGETIVEDAIPPYGRVVHTLVIRDMGGVGMEHLSMQGQEIIRAIIGLSSDNYPELMKKCFMVNTPWLFNTLWYFIQGLLNQRTIDKVTVLGTSFLDELTKIIELENLPSLVEGGMKGDEEPFVFDTSCFVLPGQEVGRKSAEAPETVFTKMNEASETD